MYVVKQWFIIKVKSVPKALFKNFNLFFLKDKNVI